MRSDSEVLSFVMDREYDLKNPKHRYNAALYRGCVPSIHWYVRSSDVKHNVDIFQSVVMKYKNKLHKAYRQGYGLLFVGDNGNGKTMFGCYILGRAVRVGYRVYYTTLSDLDSNIKIGFDNPLAAELLRYCLNADFLFIDELGKEHFSEKGFLTSKLEALLKNRYDNAFPTLLASNLSEPELGELYGPTIASMLAGKYKTVEMLGGDCRYKNTDEMVKDMGY